jgi:hypothetical protein
MVENPATMPRWRRSAWSSASLTSGRASTSRRRSLSCGAKQPTMPAKAGRGGPAVDNTRCISLIAVDGLTATAAPRRG